MNDAILDRPIMSPRLKLWWTLVALSACSGQETADGRAGTTLVFLKGDRSLEVAYGTSSADAAGAVRLAQIAVQRLADSRIR